MNHWCLASQEECEIVSPWSLESLKKSWLEWSKHPHILSKCYLYLFRHILIIPIKSLTIFWVLLLKDRQTDRQMREQTTPLKTKVSFADILGMTPRYIIPEVQKWLCRTANLTTRCENALEWTPQHSTSDKSALLTGPDGTTLLMEPVLTQISVAV